MKVGDKLKFKRFNWVITSVERNHFSRRQEARYRVQRKYFKNIISLYYTKQDYPIMSWRWNFIKKQLKENPNYHYNMHLWSNQKRKYESRTQTKTSRNEKIF